MKLLAAIFLAVFVFGACSTTVTDSVTDNAVNQTNASPEMFGGCILISPIGEVPADVYEVTDVAATNEYPPFTKELTASGLKLVAREDASDDFMRLVGKTIAETYSACSTCNYCRLTFKIFHRFQYNRYTTLSSYNPLR